MIGQRSRQAKAARSPPGRRLSQKRLSPPAAESIPVVGLGASAGGLDAFRRLLAVLPAGTGMAFILIQHLDPTHASMMVDLLADHTPLKVQQAADGMPLEHEHIYLIPPGAYLSIRGKISGRPQRTVTRCGRIRQPLHLRPDRAGRRDGRAVEGARLERVYR